MSNFKPGDWLCRQCNSHNYKFRNACRDCGNLKNLNANKELGATSKPNDPNNIFTPSKDFYMVIDFEANCSNSNARDHEIIEFPAVLVNAKTGRTVAEFRSFVYLVKTRKLSEFIKQLTHITDEQVKSGVDWHACLMNFEEWCHKNNVTPSNTMVATCGDWDLKTMLPTQLKITKTVLSKYLNELFGRWCNVKMQYQKCLNKRAGGMDKMLDELGLKLTGHHHSGIDDSRNIVKICRELMKRKTDVTEPTKIREQKLWYREHNLAYRRTKKGDVVENANDN